MNCTTRDLFIVPTFSHRSPSSSEFDDCLLYLLLFSHVPLFAAPRTAAHQALCPPLSLRVCSNSCPLTQWCYTTFSSSATPLLLLPSLFPSFRSFSSESAVCIRWPKYWRFSFNLNPSDKYSGLISFRIVGFTSLQVQGTLKSLLQHHNLKSSILPCSALIMV